MSAIKRIIVMPAALFATVLLSCNLMAQCDSAVQQQGGGFGYPTQPSVQIGDGTLGDAAHGVFEKLHRSVETYKADYRINRARGSAWPKPFSCWDRESYYAVFNQQYAAGLQVRHTLTAEFFDPETNKLNRAGEMRVANIMQVAPQANKQIFVYEDGSQPTIDRRIANIREFTDRYYQHLGTASIARSQMLPSQVPASYQQITNGKYNEGQPDPVIPVSVGGTVNQSVGN